MEVLAAFVIALLLIVPIASLIGGVAGSFAGLERSAARRASLQAAGAAAASVTPLQAGTVGVGDYQVTIRPLALDDEAELRQAGWQLYRVTVADSGGPILETIRLGRP